MDITDLHARIALLERDLAQVKTQLATALDHQTKLADPDQPMPYVTPGRPQR